MHEMGIANSILEAVHQELHRYPGQHAAKIGLHIGEYAGIDCESLRFCFEALVRNSEFEPLELDLEWCRVAEGRRGDELEIAYLELERREGGGRVNRIVIERKVLSENEQVAARIRAALADAGTLSLNFIGSPGAGKTALLEGTLQRLPVHTRTAVLTGDIQRENDAIRLRRYGFPVRQITTAGACHLDARMVEAHLENWIEEGLELLLIENVGNLVCPTSYDLGEDAKIVVLSVAEGEVKPLKYPGIFRKAELMLLNKIDLLPHVPFNLDLARANAISIHPEIEIIETSSTTGAGFDRWMKWLASRVERKRATPADIKEEEVANASK